ncbi:MAG: response regulator [Bacteroidota bacterium]|nr:response regulator [Bacteroidota bacterium]
MKLTLNRKILTGFIVCALFLLGIAIISFKNSEKFIATNYWVNHTHQVLFEFEQILVYSVDAETGERGFVITGDKNYLEPYTSSKLNIREHLEKAKELTRDNATQQKNLREIESLLEIFTRHLEDCIEVRTTEGFSKAEKMVASGVGKRSLDELRSRIYAAKEIENTLLAQREKTSENDARSFILVFIVLLIVIVIVLAIVYFIINSNLQALN